MSDLRRVPGAARDGMSDPVRNEIVLQDESLFQIHVYDRTAATPPDAGISRPKRIIEGPSIEIEFNTLSNGFRGSSLRTRTGP